MVQLELMGLMIRQEIPAVPVNPIVRADLVDLMARCLVAVFQGEGGRFDDRGNFEFERVVVGWRTSYSVLDLRLKR